MSNGNYKLYLTHLPPNGANQTETRYDISQLAYNIKHKTYISGQPGEFSFTCIHGKFYYTKNGEFKYDFISVGDRVEFYSNDNKIFYGIVFNIQITNSDKYEVKCYDKLRYLKNTNYIQITNKDASNNASPMYISDIFKMICKQISVDSKLISDSSKLNAIELTPKVFANSSYEEVFKYCVEENINREVENFRRGNSSSINYDNINYFYIRDNFGTLELTDVITNRKNKSVNVNKLCYSDDGDGKIIVLGDNSLMTSFNYNESIDNRYNRVIFAVSKTESEDDKTTVGGEDTTLKTNGGDEIVDMVQNVDAIQKYGILSKFEFIQKNYTKEQVNHLAKSANFLYCEPKKTLKLNTIGFDGFIAGDTFMFRSKKLNTSTMFNATGDQIPLYAISVSHNYNAYSHTMEIEACEDVTIGESL